MGTSDNGERIMGPRPNPITNRLSPSVATIREQRNSLVIWPYVDVYMEEVQVLAESFVVAFDTSIATQTKRPARTRVRTRMLSSER